MIFRKAEENEIPFIIEMESDIFYKEQGIPKDLDDIASKNVLWWVAAQEDEIIGTLASIHEERWEMGRFTIREDKRRNHIGTELLKYGLDETFKSGADVVYADARDTTVHILALLGAKINGESFTFFKGTCTPVMIAKEDFYKSM